VVLKQAAGTVSRFLTIEEKSHMGETIPLADRLDRGYQAWNEAVAGLADADYLRRIYRQWTLKDLLGHVYSFHDLMLRHVRTLPRRKHLASPRAPTHAYYNRREQERLYMVPLEMLRDDLSKTHERLMETIPSLQEDMLDSEQPSQWKASPGKTSLRRLLEEHADHLLEHASEVRAWRKKERI
jgi:hypothetical protein